MPYTTLISATTLNENLNNPKWIIIDARFSLSNNDSGSYAYRHGHIPTARYAHLMMTYLPRLLILQAAIHCLI